LLDIATRHASDEEVVGATFVLGDGKMVPGGSRAVPSITTGKGSKKGAKGGKKGSKWHPRWVTIATSNNDNDKETDDDEQEYIMTAERDFKRQARQPKDHFQKLLEVVYPNHTYPVKHRLKDYTMIKKCHDLGGYLQGQEALGRPRREGRDIRSRGGSDHDNLRLTLPWPQGRYATT
jgi:hypothetical protein